MKAHLRILAASLVLAVLTVAGCGPSASAGPSGTLRLTLTAGPTCPVERVPPDPNCAPRPVAGQVVVILSGDREVARGRSDAGGRLTFALPYGRYAVRALAGANGFPMPPADQTVDIGATPVDLALDFDTGIR